MQISNKDLATILENILATSISNQRYDDNIQPSARSNFDGDKVANQIQVLIQVLKVGE